MITSSTIDTISPVGMGADKFTLQLSTDTTPAYAYQSVIIEVDYSAAGISGAVLPFELIIQPAFGPGGTAGGYIRRTYWDSRPLSFVWRPQAAGQHLVVLRELFHNQWQGRLIVEVEGDPSSTPSDPWRRWSRY